MRIVRGWAVIGFVLMQGLSAPATAGAGWLWRSPGPLAEYSGSVRRFVVVPPPAEGIPYGDHRAHQAGKSRWQPQPVSAETYPWGWFGAAPKRQNISHSRYYGETRDWTIQRGN